jgi:hypothetical protein
LPRSKKFYGFIEVTWDGEGNPTTGAYREENDEERARRLHRRLPDREKG